MGDMQTSPGKRLAQSAEKAGGAQNLGLLAGLDFVLCNGGGDREGGLARAKRGAVAEPAFSVKGQGSRVKGLVIKALLCMGFFETSLSNIAFHRFERVVGFPRPVVHVLVGSSIQDSALRVGGWGLRIQN